MEIQSYNTRTLLNNQHLTFLREFEALILEKTAETLEVTQLFDEYQAVVQAEDDGILKITKSALTAEMQVADVERGNLLIGGMDRAHSAERHFKVDYKAAAMRLKVLNNAHRNAYKAGFDDETSRIRNYIQEIRSEKYKADADLIGLTEWMEPLETANELCAKLADQRNTETRDKEAIGKVKDLREKSDPIYRKLVKRINSLTNVYGDEKYADLITRWNTRIDHYRVSVSQRLGAGKGGSTGKGDNTPTPPPSGGGGEEERPGEL